MISVVNVILSKCLQSSYFLYQLDLESIMKKGLKYKPRVQEPFDYIQKIIIIGDSGVGKSNILLRFTENTFSDNYMMTIGLNFVYKIVEIDGVKIKMQVWDTAGQQKYKAITQTYYRKSQGVLIVFALDCRDSFHSVQTWIEDLHRNGALNAQVLLVGNKVDKAERQVSFEQGNKLAQNYGIKYMECSAKSGFNINEIFLTLGQKMKEKFIDETSTQQSKDKLKSNKIILSKQKSIKEKCCLHL